MNFHCVQLWAPVRIKWRSVPSRSRCLSCVCVCACNARERTFLRAVYKYNTYTCRTRQGGTRRGGTKHFHAEAAPVNIMAILYFLFAHLHARFSSYIIGSIASRIVSNEKRKKSIGDQLRTTQISSITSSILFSINFLTCEHEATYENNNTVCRNGRL